MNNTKNINHNNYSAKLLKKRKLNIMIIDDDTNVAECLKEYLEERGHNVTIVDEGTRGIYQFRTNNFDLIFLDYHLNKDGSPIYCINKKENFIKSYIDGTIITECIREDLKSEEKKSLIFAYTGDNSQSAINKFKNSGMNGVIFKPIDITILNKFMNSLELNNLMMSEIFKEYKKSLMLFNI